MGDHAEVTATGTQGASLDLHRWGDQLDGTPLRSLPGKQITRGRPRRWGDTTTSSREIMAGGSGESQPHSLRGA